MKDLNAERNKSQLSILSNFRSYNKQKIPKSLETELKNFYQCNRNVVSKVVLISKLCGS